ncbi:MAG TPA: helix-turn-helix domain-containing protein [Acidothermaceae bacterium]
MASADLLLHPVRLRIVQAFLGDRALTTTQLAAELGDVPAGSLYRHLALLTKAGVVQVVAERRVRAVVERTYTLRTFAARVDAAEAAAMTSEQHARAFTVFVGGLLADFDRYLASGQPDLQRDGVSYGMLAMWLTDAEYADFLHDVGVLVAPRLANAPGKGRRRRLVSTVMLPARDKDSTVRGSIVKRTTAKGAKK